VDENIPRSTAPALRDDGHQAVDVRDVGLRGADDVEVFAYAQSMSATLLTADRDFSSALTFRPGTHAGMVVVRIPNQVAEQRRKPRDSPLHSRASQYAACGPYRGRRGRTDENSQTRSRVDILGTGLARVRHCAGSTMRVRGGRPPRLVIRCQARLDEASPRSQGSLKFLLFTGGLS
jgi:predicted nuclease of predicted toxin-antitoxin system